MSYPMGNAPYPQALALDASSPQHALLQAIVGYRYTIRMPGIKARTIGVSNFSSYWVYVSASTATPSRAGGYAKAVAPFTSSITPIGATEFVTFLVDVGPDGSTGAVTNTPVIDVSASPMPAVAVQDVALPVSSAAGSTVTVAQLPSPAAALADNTANPTSTLIGSLLEGWDGATWDRIRATGDNADAQAVVTQGLLRITTEGFLYNGTSWDRQRTPTVYNAAYVNPSLTTFQAVWTPAVGKRFRLMRFMIQCALMTATSAGAFNVALFDGSLGAGAGGNFIFQAGASGSPQYQSTGWVDFGNGFLSGAINRAFGVGMQSLPAGIAGAIYVNACGTEE